MTGFPEATLHVSSTAEVTAFSVKLIDVHPDGPWALVSRIIQNTAQRNSRTDPEPLAPGEVTELKIELEAASYVFKARVIGLGIMISSSEFPLLWPLPQNMPPTPIHMDRGSSLPGDHPRGGQVMTPAWRRAGLPARAAPGPEATGLRRTACAGIWWRDLAGTEVSVVVSMGQGTPSNDNGARVYSHVDFKAHHRSGQPCGTRAVEAEYRFDVEPRRLHDRGQGRPAGWKGPDEAFHAVTALEVRTDGMPCFSRTWHWFGPEGDSCEPSTSPLRARRSDDDR